MRSALLATLLSLMLAGCSVGADPKPTRLESLCAELDSFTQDTKIVEADRQRIDDIRLDYCPS